MTRSEGASARFRRGAALCLIAASAWGCGRFGFGDDALAGDGGGFGLDSSLDGGVPTDVAIDAPDAPAPLDASCDESSARPEICNGLDDDCDGEVDDGYDLDTDPSACGVCGTVCASGSACVAGACIPRIAAGAAFTCAMTPTRGVKCWGSNFFGELGDMDDPIRATPRALSSLTNVVDLAAGATHACAVIEDGRVFCWGNDAHGELGNGAAPSPGTPVQVAGITDAVGIGAGTYFTCVVHRDRTLSCWGQNTYSQLGVTGAAAIVDAPTRVPSLRGVLAVDGGDAFTCALIEDGTVACFGAGETGTLGNGVRPTTTTPQLVETAPAALLRDAVMIGAGHAGACAIVRDGRMFCWGPNSGGQNGSASAPTPTERAHPVDAFSGFSSVGVGVFGASASRRSGNAIGFGHNGDGQATGTPGFGQTVPTTVMGTDGYLGATAGYSHRCVINAAGAARCWGVDSHGQRGDGDPTSKTSFVGTETDVTDVDAGGRFTCIVQSGVVKCFGINLNAELGLGGAVWPTAFATPQALTVPGTEPIAHLEAGWTSACAIRAASGAPSTAYCWGYGALGFAPSSGPRELAPRPILAPALWSHLEVGIQGNACGLASDGLYCWGSNSYGQLGIGSTVPGGSVTPLGPMAGSAGAISVSSGFEHVCAVFADGRARCAGRNIRGQLGDGTTTNSSVLVDVIGSHTFTQIAASGYYTCGVTTSGAAYCWGENFYGQIGGGTTAGWFSSPQLVSGVTNVVEIATGYTHVCAREEDGDVFCWGVNHLGAFGNGTLSGVALRPTLATTGATKLAVGGGHTCVLKGVNLFCAGEGYDGQLGNGELGYLTSAADVIGLP